MYEEQTHYNQTPIIKISIQDVLDFCYCSRYYKLRCDDNSINEQELYDKCLHKVFYSYLRRLMDGYIDQKAIGYLKYLWGQEWIKEKNRDDILISMSSYHHSNYETKRRQGIHAITAFNNLLNDVPQTPLVIDYPWEVHIAGNIYLTGRWEYIREIEGENNPIIQLILINSSSNRAVTNASLDHDLLATAMQYAFNQTFGNVANQLVYLDTVNERLRYSVRTSRDFELLKRTVISVALSLMNGIECVSMDRKCYYCEYRGKCSSSIGSDRNGNTMGFIRYTNNKEEKHHDENEH